MPRKWVCNQVFNCQDKSDEDESKYNCTEIQAKRSNNLTDAQGICNWPFIQCPGEEFCARPCSVQKDCNSEVENVEQLESGCEKTKCEFSLKATPNKQEFTSPNYPNKYEAESECTWTIKARKGMRIQLTILDLETQGFPGDCQDYFQVFDGSDLNSGKPMRVDGHGRICGYEVPTCAVLKSKKSVVTVRFHTNALLNEKGFKISYVAVPLRNNRRDAGHVEDFDESNRNAAESLDGQRLGNSRSRRSSGDDYDYGSDGDYSSGPDAGRDFSKDYSGSDYNDRSTDYVDYGNEESDYGTGEEDYDYAEDYRSESSYDYNDYYHSMSVEEYTEKEANLDIAEQFYSVQANDYFGLYKASELPDYSDFRLAAFFKQEVISHNGYQKHDFIVQCTYDGKKCDSNFFKTFQDPFYGNCFSFNSVRGQNTSKPWFIRSSSKTGQEFGLKLTLFLDISEYIGLLAPTAAVRAMIHDSRMRPQVRAQSFAVGVGEATYISLRMNEVARKGEKFSNCTDDWPSWLNLSSNFKSQWNNYDKDNCVYFCSQIEMADTCGCTDGYEFEFSIDPKINQASKQNCDLRNQTQSKCRQDVYAGFRNNSLTCDCPKECVTRGFNQRQSAAPWPTEAYAPYFASKMLQYNSERVLKYMREVLSENEVTAKNLKNNFSENFSRLEIFYEALNFEKISESEAYDEVALLSDFGGNLGLWLGWSVLIVFELIQFVFECICIIVRGIGCHNRSE